MIEIDKERNTSSILLWLIDEMISGRIALLLYEEFPALKAVQIKVSNLPAFTALLFRKANLDNSIKTMNKLLELSTNNKLVYDRECERQGAKPFAQIFVFKTR